MVRSGENLANADNITMQASDLIVFDDREGSDREGSLR